MNGTLGSRGSYFKEDSLENSQPSLKKYFLVLDLDETLIYSRLNNLSPDHIKIKVTTHLKTTMTILIDLSKYKADGVLCVTKARAVELY